MAQTSRSVNEIEDELEGLLDDYAAHMRLHRMKYRRGTLRAIVTAIAEVAENLPRLRFKRAVEPLFDVFDRKIALTEAELNAPGREVAYLVHARERVA